MSETQDFLKDLEGNQEDAFAHLNKTEDESEKDESDEIIEEGRFKGNRYTRREASKAQKYKEEAIALNAKLQAITESRSTESDSEEAEYLKKAAKIYGDAGEDGKFDPKRAEATKLLKEALQDLEKTAVEKAYSRLESERNGDTDAVKQEEQNIESDIEAVEDEFGIELSGSRREGYLNLYEKLSRKDREGNIIEFPDPITTYELYQSRTQRDSSKAQDLSSRSMTRGGQSSGSELQKTAVDNYAKERGWN